MPSGPPGITTSTTTAPRPCNRGMTESRSNPPAFSQEMQSSLTPRGPLQCPISCLCLRLCCLQLHSLLTRGRLPNKTHFPLSQGALPCLTQRHEWPRGRQGVFLQRIWSQFCKEWGVLRGLQSWPPDKTRDRREGEQKRETFKMNLLGK